MLLSMDLAKSFGFKLVIVGGTAATYGLTKEQALSAVTLSPAKFYASKTKQAPLKREKTRTF